MSPRLALSDLGVEGLPPAEPGHSALLVIAGPGLGSARVAAVLHAGGDAYTVAIRAAGVLPAGLAALDRAPPELGASDAAAREWLRAALATLTRPAAELGDDHRWWGDIGSLIMLADLVEGGAPPA